MRISGLTTVCGIVGDPVEHSLSPAMQNAAFEFTGLDYVYVPLRLPRGAAGACADAVRVLGIRGLNVTVPHKVDIMKHLDSLDADATRIGAVNTIVNREGHLRGYNTDVSGFGEGMEAQGLRVDGMEVVLLGAGGAARAVGFSLVDRKAQLTILNRDPGRADALASDISSSCGVAVRSGPLTDDALEAHVARAGLVVNTTSVGMYPSVEKTPCPGRLLRRDLVVCDVVYSPRRTALLRDAEEAGAVVVDGVEMLVRQGAKAFELWTGVQAPVGLMRDVVVKELDCASQ